MEDALLGEPAGCGRSFAARCAVMQADNRRGRSAEWLSVVIHLTILLRFWHSLAPGDIPLTILEAAAYMSHYAWRASGHRSYQRCRDWAVVCLRLITMSLVPRTMQRSLYNFSPSPSGPAATAGCGVAGWFHHLALLAFSSGIPALTHQSIFWWLPLWLNVLVSSSFFWWFQLHNAGTCAAPALASPSAQRRTHAVHQLLTMLAQAPLPVAFDDCTRQPDRSKECMAVNLWLQLVVGLLLPLCWQARCELRAFRRHQQQRREAGLPAERGRDAALYGAAGALLPLQEAPQMQVGLLVWTLLGICWMWCCLTVSH